MSKPILLVVRAMRGGLNTVLSRSDTIDQLRRERDFAVAEANSLRDALSRAHKALDVAHDHTRETWADRKQFRTVKDEALQERPA